MIRTDANLAIRWDELSSRRTRTRSSPQINSESGKRVSMAADLHHNVQPSSLPSADGPRATAPVRALRPTRTHFARPPRGAASMDTSNAALAGRLSLSILSSPTIESIGRTEKILTIGISDSMRANRPHAIRSRLQHRPDVENAASLARRISFAINELQRSAAARSMAAYLLTCDCGKTVPVEIGQAGGRVACSCGTQLDVPTLRQLRHLPQADGRTEARRPAVGARGKDAIAASLIVVAALAGLERLELVDASRRSPNSMPADHMAMRRRRSQRR